VVRPWNSFDFKSPAPAAVLIQSSQINQVGLTFWIILIIVAGHDNMKVNKLDHKMIGLSTSFIFLVHTIPKEAKMSLSEILFDVKGNAISPNEISERIISFRQSYSNAIKETINSSKVLDKDGEVFIECASHILSKFGMTRSGPFHQNCSEKLRMCWDAVGTNLKEINNLMRKSGLPRERYILEISVEERIVLIEEIWQITKELLPFTMGKTTYGLAGASKILFSVLPEIVLPTDNYEWLHVFKTVDLGDVLLRMVFNIQEWERITGRQLNDLDPSKRLTTLPSVYNVMAMHTRP
jgi:hypothetical protein